jgi:DNA-directed RNA polymerase specialized sigma subunit
MQAEVVNSAQVAKYDDLVSNLTRRFIGRHGAEFDDLFQEGREKVFEALRKGEAPAKEHILNGMRNWVRTLEYQTRYTRLRDVSYEEHQRLLLEQEETESLTEAKTNGGLDYIDTSESLYS